MLTVIMGLSVVGASDFIFSSGGSSNSLNSIITGDLLIVMAQIVTASQMVWEEKFVTKHNVPALQAVGWEGIFGFVTLSLLLIPMYFLRVGPPFSSNPRMVLEDALDGFTQMQNNPMIILAMSGISCLASNNLQALIVVSFVIRHRYQYRIFQFRWSERHKRIISNHSHGLGFGTDTCHLECQFVVAMATVLLASGMRNCF